MARHMQVSVACFIVIFICLLLGFHEPEFVLDFCVFPLNVFVFTIMCFLLVKSLFVLTFRLSASDALTFVGAGGGAFWTPFPDFCEYQKHGRAACRRYCMPFYHAFHIPPENFSQRSSHFKVNSPGQVKWPYLQSIVIVP